MAKSPFQRYSPHLYSLQAPQPGGGCIIRNELTSSLLFSFCKSLCEYGGSCLPVPSPVAGFKLVDVQSIIHSAGSYSAYLERQAKMTERRKQGGPYFSYDTMGMNAEQLLVLSALRHQFHERAPAYILLLPWPSSRALRKYLPNGYCGNESYGCRLLRVWLLFNVKH
jgi:hypothetical protein